MLLLIKPFWYKKRGGKIVYIILIANVVSMHLSATC